MKIKSFLTMSFAAVALVLGVCACGSDDDEPEVAVAEQVAGIYNGNEVIMVDNEESSNEEKTYEIVKATDTSVDIMVPASGMGPMTIPALLVKGITLTKNGNSISGNVGSYTGTVKNASGDERAYTISGVTLMFSDKKMVATFSLKYGNMPFIMTTTFTGEKK